MRSDEPYQQRPRPVGLLMRANEGTGTCGGNLVVGRKGVLAGSGFMKHGHVGGSGLGAPLGPVRRQLGAGVPVHVGQQAPPETVQLVGPLKVHLSGKHGFVPGRVQQMGPGRQIAVQDGCVVPGLDVR